LALEIIGIRKARHLRKPLQYAVCGLFHLILSCFLKVAIGLKSEA